MSGYDDESYDDLNRRQAEQLKMMLFGMGAFVVLLFAAIFVVGLTRVR